MSNQRMIARTARWTRWFVTLVLAVIIAFQLAALVPDLSHVRLHSARGGPYGQALGMLHFVFMLLALIQLLLLLRLLERGELFSSGVTRRLRAFALFALLAVTVGGLVAPLISHMTSACQPGVPCLRRFPIDTRSVWTLITSFVFFLVARLLDEARRIDEDNRQII